MSEEYFKEDKKEFRKLRKVYSDKDRSKYKKTDQKKIAKNAPKAPQKENLIRGRVLSISGLEYRVEHDDQVTICFLRGLLKKEKTRLKTLVAVGDFVIFEPSTEGEGYIWYVEPRKTILSRADSVSRRKEQIIASNIDQVIITTSVHTPPLKPFLVDRYIIATRKGGMDPVIVVNKIDLLDDDDQEYKEFLKAYQLAQVPVISISCMTEEGLDKLREAMKGKSSVFSGQSGAGKSSLINKITGLDLPVGEVISRTRKGAHTTTRAHLVKLDFGGWCIDTPGIKSFGVWDLSSDEIEQFYTEIHEVGMGCKFPNCSHTHEKKCAVLEAVEQGKISKLRYDSYEALMESVSKKHFRR